MRNDVALSTSVFSLAWSAFAGMLSYLASIDWLGLISVIVAIISGGVFIYKNLKELHLKKAEARKADEKHYRDMGNLKLECENLKLINQKLKSELNAE